MSKYLHYGVLGLFFYGGIAQGDPINTLCTNKANAPCEDISIVAPFPDFNIDDSVPVCGGSITGTYTVQNNRDFPLTITFFDFAVNDNLPDEASTVIANTCMVNSLAPHATCTVTVSISNCPADGGSGAGVIDRKLLVGVNTLQGSAQSPPFNVILTSNTSCTLFATVKLDNTPSNTGSCIITQNLACGGNICVNSSAIGDFGGWTSANVSPGQLVDLNISTIIPPAASNDASSLFKGLNKVSCTENLTGMDLGGQTLTPGVYCFDGDAHLNGTLTLDFTDSDGDSDGTFIFKIKGNLFTNDAIGATGSQVVAMNAPTPNPLRYAEQNTFWSVHKNANLGLTFPTTQSGFIGQLLVQGNINFPVSNNSSEFFLLQGNAFAFGSQSTIISHGVSSLNRFVTN